MILPFVLASLIRPLNLKPPRHETDISLVTAPPALPKASFVVPPAEPTVEELPPPVVVAPVAPVVVSTPQTCGDNFYANYIYMHESGCNPGAVNSIGCRGIGQACPGSKLPCGADYACQNAYFTAYASAAYGGWAGAYAHWLAFRWW